MSWGPLAQTSKPSNPYIFKPSNLEYLPYHTYDGLSNPIKHSTNLCFCQTLYINFQAFSTYFVIKIYKGLKKYPKEKKTRDIWFVMYIGLGLALFLIPLQKAQHPTGSFYWVENGRGESKGHSILYSIFKRGFMIRLPLAFTHTLILIGEVMYHTNHYSIISGYEGLDHMGI